MSYVTYNNENANTIFSESLNDGPIVRSQFSRFIGKGLRGPITTQKDTDTNSEMKDSIEKNLFTKIIETSVDDTTASTIKILPTFCRDLNNKGSPPGFGSWKLTVFDSPTGFLIPQYTAAPGFSRSLISPPTDEELDLAFHRDGIEHSEGEPLVATIRSRENGVKYKIQRKATYKLEYKEKIVNGVKTEWLSDQFGLDICGDTAFDPTLGFDGFFNNVDSLHF